MSHSDPNRRDFYRLQYPEGHRPVAKIGGHRFETIEISEHGLRLDQLAPPADSPSPLNFETGSVHTVGIELPDGPVIVVGEILRHEGNVIVFRLEQGISFARMLEEQRRLRRLQN